MATFGGITLSDNLINAFTDRPVERPGYGAVFSAAAQQALGQLRYGLPLQYHTLQGDLTPEDARFYQQGLARAQAAGEEAAPAGLQDLTSGRVGFGRFVGENLVGMVPFMAGALAGSAAGAAAGSVVPGVGTVAGGIAGGILGGTPQFSGSNVARAVEEQGTLTPEAAQRAALVAPLQSAADIAIGRYLPFARALRPEAGGFLSRTIKSVAEAGGTEAVTEAAQQLGERYAAGLPVSDADAAGEYVNAAVTAFAVGGVMGAGGGIRRAPVDSKPAEQVSDQDMIDHTSAVLSLPSPQMFGRQPGGPEIGSGAPVPVDAAGRQSAAGMEPAILANLPRPGNVLELSEADTPAALATRFQTEQAARQAELDAAAPNVLAQPQLPAFEEGQVPTAPTDTSVAALAAQPQVVPAEVAAPEIARPLEGVDLADLQKARKAKNADPAIIEAVDAEITARQQEDPFLGVRLNQDIAKLRDKTPEEMRAGVVDLLENGDSRTGTFQLAERLGIDVNAPGEPTQVATDLDTQAQSTLGGPTEPASSPVTRETAGAGASQEQPTTSRKVPQLEAPETTVDPEFRSQWAQIMKDAGIQRLQSAKGLRGSPANLQDAQTRVVSALADVDAFKAPDKDQVEKLARTMGLVTDDNAMDFTPLGRQAYLNTAPGLSDTTAAAQQQGYEGTQAAMFDRAVRAAAIGDTTTPEFASVEDRAAYTAGQVWAQDFIRRGDVATAAQTAGTQARQDTRATATESAGAGRGEGAGRVQLTPQQVNQKASNNLIDSTDLRTVPDSDVATLRRMAREGAPVEQVAREIERLQGGQSLFRQPERVPYMAPEARGGRGQPIARNQQGQPLYREGPRLEDTKSAQRRESRMAVQKFQTQQALRQAHNEGDLSRAEFMKANAALANAKTAADIARVADSIPGYFAEARNANRTADPVLEQAIDGKSTQEVIDHLISTAPTALDAGIMRAVKNAAQLMEKIGVPINFTVAHDGTEVPSAMIDGETRALTWARHNPAQVDIWINGADLGSQTGMNWETVAHELIHAVTLGLVTDAYRNSSQYKNTQTGRAVQDLEHLTRQIEDFIQQRLDSNAQLTPFEERFLSGEVNAFQDVNEIISWGLTNPDMQEYLDAIPYSPKQSMWDKFVDLLRKVFGLPTNSLTALDGLLHVSEALITAPEAELRNAWVRNISDDSMAALRAAPTEENTAAANRTVGAANTVTQRAAAAVTDAFERVTSQGTIQNMRDKMRELGLGGFSRHHISQIWGDLIPGLRANERAHEDRLGVRNTFQLAGANAAQAIEKLRQSKDAGDRRDAERIRKGMLLAQFGIDVRKPWDAHGHLHGEPNAANLKELWEAGYKDYGDLARHQRADLFDNAVAANEAQNYGQMVGMLYKEIANNEEYARGVRGGAVSPADALLETEGLGTAQALRDHMRNELDTRIAAAKDFLEERGKLAAGQPAKERTDTMTRLSSLQSLLAEIEKSRTTMAQQPYFHLPRFGDNFVSFQIVKDGDVVSKPALEKVAAAVAKLGTEDVQFSADNTNPRVMIRTANRSVADALQKLGLELEAAGLVEKGSTSGGPRSRENNYGLPGRVPDYVARAFERLETDPAFQWDASTPAKEREAIQKQLAATKQALVDSWLDMQPDNSLSRVLANRKNVQGASADMIRGFADRQNVGAVGIAAMMTQPKFTEALRSMRDTVEESHRADSDLDPYMTSSVVREVRLRDLESPINEMADTYDKLRAVSHTYYLGLNPSSSLINMSALGVTVLPELAKRHGVMKSFHAMRRASTQAGAILKAAFADAQARGFGHRADLSLTEDVLKAANIPEDVRAFVRRRVAAGDVDLGTMSRALGQLASGKADTKLDQALRYGTAFNIYSEAFARLVAVIAARELHGTGNSLEAHEYARNVVKDTLFEFQPGATGRYFGKQGLLGPVTPVVAQFMQWNLQVTEKLAREFRDALGKQRPGETAETAAQRRQEAQRFLMMHMTAVTALAGTLGLPFATVAAGVIDKLLGDDDDPFDAAATWRNFLADVLGKDMGEVVARGLPRALGFDVSARAGEQNLLPFSEFLADKRSWRDATTDAVGRGIGAGPNMLVSVLDGGNTIASGDLIGGMKQILPVALKSPLEVYRLSTEGYVDTKGNRLPMSPGARDIMWQLLGFTPSAKAEYSEARGDQAARSGQLQRRAGMLRQRIAQAVISGDNDTARDLIQQAIEFDKTNNTSVVQSLGASVQGRRQAMAQAQNMGTPIGVRPQDVAARQLTQYANF